MVSADHWSMETKLTNHFNYIHTYKILSTLPRTKKSWGVDRRTSPRMDLSEPCRDNSGPSDHTHVPSLTQHSHQQRRQYPKAGPHPYHIRYPFPTVWSYPKCPWKRRLGINLHSCSIPSIHSFPKTKKTKNLREFVYKCRRPCKNCTYLLHDFCFLFFFEIKKKKS